MGSNFFDLAGFPEAFFEESNPTPFPHTVSCPLTLARGEEGEWRCEKNGHVNGSHVSPLLHGLSFPFAPP